MTILPTRGVPPAATSHRGASLRMCLRLVLVPLMLSSLVCCSKELGCNEPVVRQALDQALDNMYAEARNLAKVAVTITDIVSVNQTAKRASCKALLHISVDFIGLQKEERDPTIEYVAEITEQGRTFVTITTPP